MRLLICIAKKSWIFLSKFQSDAQPSFPPPALPHPNSLAILFSSPLFPLVFAAH